MKAELGDEVKCKVTSLKGVVTAVTKQLTGCDRATVQPAVGKDGKMPDGWNIDLAALDVLKKAKVKIESVREGGPDAKMGGPMTKAKRN